MVPVLLFAAVAVPTFSHDIAPILYRNCVVCHRPSGVAPFSLLTYEDAAKRARLIADVTARRYMPPWLPAEPRFAHELKLTAGEIAMIGKWAAANAPEGDSRATPRAPEFAGTWSLGPPDLEAELPVPFHVPAEGPDIYQCLVIPAPSPRDRWVRALDIRPGNASVVHHVILFQDTTRTARRRDQGAGYSCFGTPGFLPARGLGGWTPGALPAAAPEGIPTLLHGNADLVLQIHYHPTGKPETDRTRIALYFTDRPPVRRMMDVPLSSTRIDIPAGDSAYKVTDQFTIPVDVDAIGIIPHAHYICRSMTVTAILPNGKRRTLLQIPEWNFNWQQQYRYPVPVRLPEDTRLEMEFVYDNSAANPRNPNHPPVRVTYGPSTTDEMAGVHLEVTAVDPADEEELSATISGRMNRPRR